jgi:hypothetical protein
MFTFLHLPIIFGKNGSFSPIPDVPSSGGASTRATFRTRPSPPSTVRGEERRRPTSAELPSPKKSSYQVRFFDQDVQLRSIAPSTLPGMFLCFVKTKHGLSWLHSSVTHPLPSLFLLPSLSLSLPVYLYLLHTHTHPPTPPNTQSPSLSLSISRFLFFSLSLFSLFLSLFLFLTLFNSLSFFSFFSFTHFVSHFVSLLSPSFYSVCIFVCWPVCLFAYVCQLACSCQTLRLI